VKKIKIKVADRKKEVDHESGHASKQSSVKESKVQRKQAAEHLSLKTLAIAVKTFRPSMLNNPILVAANPLNIYCAVRLWQRSGLVQQHELMNFALRYGGNRTRAESTSKSHKVFDLNHSADRVYTIGTEGSHHM